VVRWRCADLRDRIAAEAVGMVLIAFLAYYLTGARTGFATALPILGAITLGAQWLLPLMQQIYQGAPRKILLPRDLKMRSRK
jgi:hypothetical protein